MRGSYRKPDPTNPSADRFQDTKNYPRSALGLVRSGLLKAIRRGVCWVWLSRLRKRLPRLQRHLGGQYWRTATCQRENGNCADPFTVMPSCQEATLGSSALTRDTGPVFCWSCFCFLHCSVHSLSHHTQDSLRKEPCVSRTLSFEAQVAKKSHNKTSPVQI